jgi:hypothetical protein
MTQILFQLKEELKSKELQWVQDSDTMGRIVV